ncbi:CHASE domain-containing protein [Sulfitobacter sp.]|uniref:CHASE domain-containing protein n=1 Tax=Sulfitobacter sp. TaxID=1903071 RepID=UPI0030025C73
MIFSNWSRGIIVSAVAFLTILFAIYVDRLEASRTYATFDSYAAEGERGLINRTDTYIMTLDAASGLLISSNVVTSDEWRSYIDLLDIETRLPGILGVGYITLVRAGAYFDITKAIVQRGLTIPPIYPNTGLDERFVIQFIEPISDNKAVLGLDIGFEPMRRAAAQQARETNTLRLSGAITLVQDNEKKSGFLLLRPVYDSQADLSVPQQREEAFRGWTYMPFTANAVFEALTAQRNEVKNLTVVDITDPDAKIEIYTNRPELLDHSPSYTATRNIELFGRHWEMTWTSTPMFEHANSNIAKWIVLALGLALTWLLAVMLRIISGREKQIETEVSVKTLQLRAKTGEAQSVIDNAVFSIIVLDENGRIVSTNKAARDLFGTDCLKINQPISSTLTIGEFPDRLHGDAHPARVANQPDLRLLVEENEWRTETGELRKSLLVQDVTEILAAEQKLQEAEARWNMALAGAQIGVFDIDLTTQK